MDFNWFDCDHAIFMNSGLCRHFTQYLQKYTHIPFLSHIFHRPVNIRGGDLIFYAEDLSDSEIAEPPPPTLIPTLPLSLGENVFHGPYGGRLH